MPLQRALHATPNHHLGGLKLVNAKLFAGATVSPRQAAELVRAMGLNVA